MPYIIADQSWNIFAPFGVTSWGPLLANLVAFILMVIILRVCAFKPIQAMLEQRKQRIAQGEEMREQSERRLAAVQQESKEILQKAGEQGQEQIEHAKLAAARLLEQQEAAANEKAQEILQKAKELAALQQEQDRRELKAQFSRLVALATEQVAGKTLTAEDQHRLNQQTIDSLDG